MLIKWDGGLKKRKLNNIAGMRKIFALIMFSAFAWGAVAQTVNPKQAWKKAESRTQLTEEEASVVANMVHEKYVSLDSHNDTAGWLNHPDGDFGVTKGQVTFPLMKEGGLDAAFFAIYLDQGPLNDFSRDSVYNYAMNEIALFKKYIAEHSDEAEIGYAPEDLKKIKKKGKRCVVFALENGYGIGKDLDKINKFYDEGVRYITLCHNYVNDICDASRYTKGHSWGGLSEFGYKVVERMNELGMIIDFSHASSSTLWDLLECSKAPVIATHSSVWELKKNNRNLKDDEIKAIAKAGGLIQLASGRFFLSDLPKKEVTIKHLADHIDYVKNLVGAEYIGLGTDFDGGGGLPGLEDASRFNSFTRRLMREGFSDDDLSKIWGRNFIRVWKQIIKQ